MSNSLSERDYRRAASAARAIQIVDNIRRQARTFSHSDPSAAIIRQRTRLEKSLAKWLRFYMRGAFTLPFGDDHLKAIAKLQTAINKGGMFALAMPRGAGKTTICRAAALFAVLTGARAYVLFVAATQTDAEAAVEFIRHQLLENERLKHYPHAAVYIQAGEDKSNRAKYQLRSDGKSTGLRWNKSGLTLPSGISDKGASCYPSDGAIIEAAGLTGSIRGKARDGQGKVIRPDLVILDDCQTRESAESPSQCAARERIIGGDIQALAGPRKKIACAAISTIIRKGDLADRLLDKKLHPEFSGETFALIHAWPTAQETLWQEYSDLYKSGLADSDTREAFDFYRTHRVEMDAGAEVSWPARIRKGEINALQTAENLKIEMGNEAFMSEMQNSPLSAVGSQYELTIEMILAHALDSIPRLHLPPLTTVFVGSVDINRAGLHFCLAGFDQSMTGHTPLYGKHPQQGDLWRENAPELDRKRAIFGGLKSVCDMIAGTYFMRGAQRLQPSLILIDLGFEADVVHRFCNSFAYPFKIIPSAGRAAHKYFIKRDALISRPYEGCHVQKSDNGPYLIFNADLWRESMQRAFLADPGAPGGFTLYAAPDRYHVAFAEHLVAERLANKYETDRGVRWEWTHAPGSHWDWSDALVGCWTAAAASGLSTSGIPLPRKQTRPAPRRQCKVEIGEGIYKQEQTGRRLHQKMFDNR